MTPEKAGVCAVVRMPASVLSAWSGVEVDDGVNLLRSTKLNYAIEVHKRIWTESAWVGWRLKVTVPNGDPDTVE